MNSTKIKCERCRRRSGFFFSKGYKRQKEKLLEKKKLNIQRVLNVSFWLFGAIQVGYLITIKVC